jgi:hypothetical protein
MCMRSPPDVPGCAPKRQRKRTRSTLDGRTSSARRYAALVNAFTAEIGGSLSESELGLVKQSAALALRCEQLQAAIIRGEEVDDDLLVRISGTSKRLLGAISAKVKKPAGGNALEAYLAAKAAAAEADDEEDED